MLLILYYVSVIISLSFAFDEEPVSINKPIVRSPKPWHFSTDYVRCFCNLPSCVTTGYMCKSSGGGCFSEVQEESAVYRGRHGCLELLSEKDRKSKCNSKGGMNERTTIRRKDNPKSLFICCHHDMCNHIESPQTKNFMNNTLLGDGVDDSESRMQHQQQETFLYSSSDVWFRAATIAVPICGAIILFILIAMAVKILKSEQQNSAIHKLGPAMYMQAMPQQCKTSNEKYCHSSFEKTYDSLLRKDYIPTHHQNILQTNHNEDLQHQIHMPLLLQNDLLSAQVDKNQKSNSVDPTKTVILDIEKNASDTYSGRNVNTNPERTGGVQKFCRENAYSS